MRLKGKKAIVTGANRSIGKAIAIAFAREGADVVISYRSDKEGAEKTLSEIEKVGGKAKAIYADFLNTEEVETFFSNAESFLGGVDILVNNAGGYDTQSILEVPIATYEGVLKLGSVVPLILIRLTAKGLIKRGVEGSVLNISSVTGEKPHPNRIAHASAKSALNMITKCSALELAEYGIRVNAISPGSTPYVEGEVTLDDTIPLKRAGRGKDQADAAVFLSSEEASWITGQVIKVDGGQTL
ncbi:MAG: Glucose 1-dehydrogenase 2 [Chlamydiia bacterium]|nr:Glucose 1-dehydrogenase 2 [Chlamydiia bacterium]